MTDFYSQQNRMFAGEFGGNDEDSWPLGVGSESKGRHSPDVYSGPGHPLTVFPGYGVNPARNNGADVEPIPITPVKHQNWPEMQIQLKNGWADTNFGHKMSYDDYLRLLTSSNEMARNYLAPGRNGVAGGNVRTAPSPLNVQATAQAGPGSQPSNPGGPGVVTNGVTNGGWYG